MTKKNKGVEALGYYLTTLLFAQPLFVSFAVAWFNAPFQLPPNPTVVGAPMHLILFLGLLFTATAIGTVPPKRV